MCEDMNQNGVSYFRSLSQEVRDKERDITNMGKPTGRSKRERGVATREATAIRRSNARWRSGTGVAKAQADQERVLAETVPCQQAREIAEARSGSERAQFLEGHETPQGTGRQGV